MASGSRTIGRLGGLLALAGILIFFLGVFGLGKMLVIVGVGVIIVSLVAFFIDEFVGSRPA
jgi:hypothetical protein